MDRERPRRGWTFGRAVGLIVAILALAGLGFGSACGLMLAVGLRSLWIFLGVVGGVILIVLFLRLAEAIVRRVEGRAGGRR